jgi:uncharacterized protein YnzC (UPF0291/DUF896 family)
MGRKKKQTELTDEEIKEKRRKYMRDYYLKRKHSIVNGEYKKQESKPPKIPPLEIKRGEFIVHFD